MNKDTDCTRVNCKLCGEAHEKVIKYQAEFLLKNKRVISKELSINKLILGKQP